MKRQFKFGRQGLCTYCGDVGDSFDHCMIPVSSRINNRRKGRYHTGVGPMTFACRECNGHLSDRRFMTFWDRCTFAQCRLEKLAKPINWTNAEIQALDASLQSIIARDVAKRKWLRYRADWFQSREFCLNAEALLWDLPEDERARAYFGTTILYIKEVTRWK